jgi:hypothetical protein
LAGVIIGPPRSVVDFYRPKYVFDQAGNVWEWNEDLLTSSTRGIRGAGWSDHFTPDSSASFWSSVVPHTEFNVIGFRVAGVPEPATMELGAMAMAMLLRWRTRRR